MSQLTPFVPQPAALPRGGGAASVPATRAPAALGQRAKAAIVVQFLLNEGADVPLSALPESLQADLTQQLGRMRYVDRATLDAVITEFADALEQVGMSFPGDMAGALSALDGKISPQTAARLRKEAGVRRMGDPWERINAESSETLAKLIETESIEVAAVMLSKIDVARAAELLGHLPGPRARRITYAVSKTAAVTPETVDRIGLSLAAQLDARPPKAFAKDPVNRVGSILNFSASATRDDVLTGLDETDSAFAEEVRRKIFTFENIYTRLAPEDAPKVTRDVENDVLAMAFGGAQGEEQNRSVEFLLENLSRRMAATLREEAAERASTPRAEVEAAQSQVVAAIRAMADSGEITLRTAEPDA
ncbi:Flagellar motor switch protein FliG [Roseivivax sp. THAF40]|uniref:flagellar motor switch protein FliG n=1 Tax=unclassified Roseivivax TaxID=2639302 RepID=UPI001269184F|nr:MULTISPECIES: FliG C-terminal domain-containing protein [unclassified Roseivivax]QFS82724.1 Flagellar motor switch protein FliG [Roseivivax sp. THAF197b]QFT46493.1 Flagellar motor switch protein FliG [Roseivivax sp. THAF40]